MISALMVGQGDWGRLNHYAHLPIVDELHVEALEAALDVGTLL